MSKDELYARIDNDFVFHPATDDLTKDSHEEVRRICRQAATVVTALCPEGRELSLALTKLEEAMFWANAAIARSSPT